jgi:lipopolysaccharide/colanic/teichoic acid biosynthesis glycosyltransferase
MRVFSVILPVRVSGLLFSEFILTLGCYLAAEAIVFQDQAIADLRDGDGIARLLLVCFSVLLGIFLNNLYADTRVGSKVLLVLKMCNVAGIAFIVQGVLAYVSSGLGLPRTEMMIGTGLSFLTLVAWRIFYGTAFLRMIGIQKILFVGNDHLIQEIAARIRRHPELGVGICGYLEDRESREESLRDDPEFAMGECLGSIEDLDAVVERLRPDRIVVGGRDRRSRLPFDRLLKLGRSGTRVEEAASTFESVCGRVSSRELRASQIIFRNELAARPGSLALQSIYANLAGIAGIVVTSPLLVLCALAVKLTSRGPILEPDVRIGQHGIPFNLNRFRCHRLPGEAPGETLEDRLTPAGRWLLKWHLVNLPRVLNLLRGEITLVGPRPERPEFVEELSRYFAYYRQRHSVKPGMTGWSQINILQPEKRRDTLMQLEYDLYYTKHISLALDAYILLHGIRQMLPFAGN